MKRGDIVIVSVPGDYGKPRPVVVVQNDDVAGTYTTLVCLITTSTRIESDFRLFLAPNVQNGLLEPSFVMLDKTTMMLRRKCGAIVGRLTSGDMAEIDIRLAFILGLAR